MKNEKLFALKEAILKVKEKGSNRFKLALILNEIEIDKYISALNKLREPSEGYKEFLEKRRELFIAHAEVDEKGELILYEKEGGKGVRKFDFGIPNIVRSKAKFEKGMKELGVEYKEILEKEKVIQEDFNNTLQEECEVKLKEVSIEDVPEMEYDLLKVFIEVGVVKVV